MRQEQETEGRSKATSEASAEPGRRTLEPLRIARRRAAAVFEREYVTTVLEQSGGNITRAAAIAAVSRQMIQKLMRKYGL